MNKLDEALNALEDVVKRGEGTAVGKLLMNRLNEIRDALAGCLILEWHPASENPEKNGEYLCRVEEFTWTDTGYESEHLDWLTWDEEWNLFGPDVIEWTDFPRWELPERKSK